MLMIQRISSNIALMTRLCYMFNQKPRDPSIPTQKQFMTPYSINFLHDNKGAMRYTKQLGRGPGNGKGKTSGRGHKGQLARQGGHVHVKFEGGQTPITRRLPKYGRVFKKRPQQFLEFINLGQIDYYVRQKVIDATKTITIKTLVDIGLAKPRRVTYGIKILAKGCDRIDYPMNIQATDASKSVIQKLKSLGGSIKLLHRTPLKLKEHIFPDKYPLPLADPITPWWKVQKLMRKQQDRGISIQFVKPKWMLQNPIVKKVQPFTYPYSRQPNPQKIRKRKAKLFRKINYGI